MRIRALAIVLGVALSLAACVPIRQRVGAGHGGADVQPPSGTGKAGKPVETGGTGTTPAKAPSDKPWEAEMEGLASWYGKDFNGRLTASGEVYDMYQMTAAHKTLPLGTVVKVHDLDNGKSIKVRINDRGPYVEGRVIDLSRTAARALGMREDGTTHVKLEVVHWP